MRSGDQAPQEVRPPLRPWRRAAAAYPWRWVLWWLAFPNIAILAMWPLGGPVMQTWLQFSGLLAILLDQVRNGIVRRLAVPVLMLGALYLYVLGVFGLGYFGLAYALALLSELSVLESPEYAAAGAALLVCLALAFVEPPKVRRLKGAGQLLLAALTALALAYADLAVNWATYASYSRTAPAGTRFESAVNASGVGPDTLASRNLVIVMVESLGTPRASIDRALLQQIWDRPEWRDRYHVSQGTIPYFGATTTAEIRELCGVYAETGSFDFAASDCLPKQFRRAGFKTSGFHSFTSSFFNRGVWYSQLGFSDVRFSDRLLNDGAAPCDGVLAGACDRDIPAIIARQLQSDGDRHLVYWLTLNSHLPILASEALETQACSLGPPDWRESYPMLCRLYQVQQQLSDSLTEQIVSGGFADSDILIVGDHNPPFFRRSLRARFEYGRVPWIHLKARSAAQDDTA
jgi:hypothetical protein